MSAVTPISTTNLDFDVITAIVNVQNGIVLAAKHPNGILERMFSDCFGLFVYNRDSKPEKMFGKYKNIPDMARVETSSFAFIDQGRWKSSDIHLVQLQRRQDGKAYWKIYHLFSTDANCCGISVTDDCYFLTFSGIFQDGNVKMLDSKGTVKQIITADSQGKPLFSKSLSRIYVDNDLRMWVADTGKKQLTVIKVTSVSKRAKVEAEYDNTEVNCIIQKGNRDLFVAIGGQKNEVVLHSEQGPKKIVRQNELTGTPTALCLAGEALLVATTEGWLSSTRITHYKDKEGIRRDEHVISM